MSHDKTCSCDDVDYHRQRADDAERRERDRIEEQQREWERQRQATRERMLENEHTADNWDDAFSKQRRLLQQEMPIAQDNLQWAKTHNGDLLTASQADVDHLNAQLVGIERARVIYADTMRDVEERIRQMRVEALEAVAAQIDAEEIDAMNVQDYLRSDSPSDWLDW